MQSLRRLVGLVVSVEAVFCLLWELGYTLAELTIASLSALLVMLYFFADTDTANKKHPPVELPPMAIFLGVVLFGALFLVLLCPILRSVL